MSAMRWKSKLMTDVQQVGIPNLWHQRHSVFLLDGQALAGVKNHCIKRQKFGAIDQHFQ
jgi:hypothetical protein